MQPTGSILWQGKSRIDGSPIQAILTYYSENRGTGDIAQTWIMRSDINPIEAIASNLDTAVCGNCPLRGDKDKGTSCYVNPAHGPSPIFKAAQKGLYPLATSDMLRFYLKRRKVRLGAYGDPCAVPIRVWRNLLKFSSGHTGYTHQWRESKNKDYRSLLMASCESIQDIEEAQSLGWRSFRIYAPGDSLHQSEIRCPKSEDIDPFKRLNCLQCGACDGNDRIGKKSVAILAHGSRPKLSNTLRLLALRES